MVNPPRTIQQAMKRLYGAHPGEAYKVECCAYEIVDPHFGSRQCFRKTGHGRAGLYCRQHAAATEPHAERREIVPGSKEHLDWLSTFCGI